MRVAGWILAVVAAFAGGFAHAQEEPTFHVGGLWVMLPQHAAVPDVEPQPRTAPLGAFLFEQNMTAAVEAVVQARADIALPLRLGRNAPPPVVTYEPGDGLALMAGFGSLVVFCDPRIAYESQSFWDGRRLRLCLVDDDVDGVLDHVMWSGAVEGNFTAMEMSAMSTDSQISIPYTLRRSENPSLIVAGPIVTRTRRGAHRVGFAVRYNGAPMALDDINQTGTEALPDGSSSVYSSRGFIFRASDLPLTVDIMGARIEFISADGDTLSYRVLSQFDAQTPTQVGYRGVMGVDSVANSSGN